MADPAPANARDNAQAETRAAARWLIAAFAAVGAVLLSGVGLTGLGELHGSDLFWAFVAVAVGALGVIAAISLITDVLTPTPISLSELARLAEQRNEKSGRKRDNALVCFIEADPSLLQGMVDRAGTDAGKVLIVANKIYVEAVDERTRTAERYWDLAKSRGTADAETQAAELTAKVANNRSLTFHNTVRRLERIATDEQAVIKFRRRRPALGILAIVVTVAIGAFAYLSNPPEPATADLRGADLERMDLSGASLRGANLSGMTLRGTDLHGTDLGDAAIDKTVWRNVTCPDGTNSHNAGDTCEGHLEPFRPDELP